MPRVVSDREGGFVAIEPLKTGKMVVVIDGISPPLLTRRDRRLRRLGFRSVMLGNLWLALWNAASWGLFWLATR